VQQRHQSSTYQHVKLDDVNDDSVSSVVCTRELRSSVEQRLVLTRSAAHSQMAVRVPHACSYINHSTHFCNVVASVVQIREVKNIFNLPGCNLAVLCEISLKCIYFFHFHYAS